MTQFRAAVPNLFGTWDQFHGRQLFHGWGGVYVFSDGFQMIQAHCIYCALYFYYYYISSTSDHQALDPGGLGGYVGDPCQGEERWLACREQEAGSRGRPCLTLCARQLTKPSAHCLMSRNLWGQQDRYSVSNLQRRQARITERKKSVQEHTANKCRAMTRSQSSWPECR